MPTNPLSQVVEAAKPFVSLGSDGYLSIKPGNRPRPGGADIAAKLRRANDGLRTQAIERRRADLVSDRRSGLPSMPLPPLPAPRPGPLTSNLGYVREMARRVYSGRFCL